MKGTEGQAGEETHRVRPGRILSPGVSVPVDLRSPSQHMAVLTNLEAPRAPCFWDLREASSYRDDQLFSPFPAPLPSLEKALGVGTENSKLIPWKRKWQLNCSILAWRIPWTKEPGGYSPWYHKESDTTKQLNNNNKFIAWSSW